MVCQFGMSRLGPLTFGNQEEMIFLGREISQHRDYSEETARAIDKEVHGLVTEGYDRARRILTDNRDALIRIAEALLVSESLDGATVKMLIAGQTLDQRSSVQSEPTAGNPIPAPVEGGWHPTPALPHNKPAPA